MRAWIVRMDRDSDLRSRDVFFTFRMVIHARDVEAAREVNRDLARLWFANAEVPIEVGPFRADALTDQELDEMRQECTNEIASRMLEAAGYA